jgi:hypothetical protein
VADKLFSRERIRQHALGRWSAQRMADDYLQLYRSAQEEAYAAEGAEPGAAAPG